MIIETKYNIGDVAWIIRDGKARVGHIESVCFRHFITSGRLHTQKTYDISSEGQRLYHIDESVIFPTKEELLKSL